MVAVDEDYTAVLDVAFADPSVCTCSKLRPNVPGLCKKHQARCCNWCGRLVLWGWGDDGCDHTNRDTFTPSK